MTAADVCNVTGHAIRLLLAGELRAREASALAQLCNSLYRVIPRNPRDNAGRAGRTGGKRSFGGL